MRSRSLTLAMSSSALAVFVACGSSVSGGDTADASCSSDPACVDGGVSDVLGDLGGDLGGEVHADVAPDTTPIPCGSSAWSTYGHDARRTFATDACITGPLDVSWIYVPKPPTGRTTKAVTHALAQADAVFLQWGASDDPYVGTTALDRVSTTTGTPVWTYDTGTDANEGNWGSIVASTVALNDDGVYFVDAATGKGGASTGVDWWGQSIPNGTGIWFVTTSKSDGPGLFVGAMDATAKVTWKQNEQGTACGDGFADTMGGIAVDGGVLFYAPSYNAGTSGKTLDFASGVYAFDAATGTPKWKVAATPTSVISAGDGHVYLVESGTTLIARKQSDGSKDWDVAVTGAGAQAPVLSGGLVIVGTASGIVTFDAKTGAPGWTAKMSGAAARAYTITITNGCSGTQNQGAAIATSIAVAEASKTVVVTASDGIHILDLATGAAQWTGKVTGVKTALHDPVMVGDVLYAVDSSPSSIGGFGSGSLFALRH